MTLVTRSMDDFTTAALNRGLYFRERKPLALISGAGIAGLAASFELRARGFNVVVAEKRTQFDRFNIINLDIVTQVFLKRFGLLEKFEQCVAARIKEHRYVVMDKAQAAKPLAVSDVSGLQLDESTSFEPEHCNDLFKQDGVYSVSIRMLQTFLAEHALEAGVNIFGNVTLNILARTDAGGVSEAQITGDRTLRPDVLLIAEGAHPTTAHQLGMTTKSVTNACTGEHWAFGNMTYSGQETFVVSLIDTSAKTVRLANVIFNAPMGVVNIAVTTDPGTSEERIREQILQTAHQVFQQQAFPLAAMDDSQLLTTVRKPVAVSNRTSSPFSMGNVFCIGDAAGSSSPLAGLGGTLGLTLVPRTVRQLADDYESHSGQTHEHFHRLSEAYTQRWTEKSVAIKRFCMNLQSPAHHGH